MSKQQEIREAPKMTVIPLWAPTMPIELDDNGDLIELDDAGDLIACPYWITDPHGEATLDGQLRRCIRVRGHRGSCI